MKDWRMSLTTATVSVSNTRNMQEMVVSGSSYSKRQRILKLTWSWTKSWPLDLFEMATTPTTTVLETA